MRRGHPGVGGWRSDNPRHFRPRSSGTPHFRPPRNYTLIDSSRFPPPGSRSHRAPPPFNTHHTPEHHERSTYRIVNRPNTPRPSERGLHQTQRSNFPFIQRMRVNDTNYSNQYQDNRNLYDDVEPEASRVNIMGDVDHRQRDVDLRLLTNIKNHDTYNHHRISSWTHHSDKRNYGDERIHVSKHYLQHENTEGNKIPMPEYIGHRPPSSDHYGGNPGSAIDNSNSFSRSVDDTVDIVRRKLMNRNEVHDSHQHCEDQMPNQSEENPETRSHELNDYHNIQEPPTKKRIPRQQTSNVKHNCDKIKNNIVHQLFKMDKDKIHKLMDNPNSSTKFEYAISSLITESQNSLNRHLRSVAEKSLTSSSDFIHNDNNTIYEDTFMKQMQCILDPQDTVFLEDIKPLVMAELSKVLHLDDYYEQQFDASDDLVNNYPIENPNYEHYSNEMYNYEDYNKEPYFEDNQPAHSYEGSEHTVVHDTSENYQPHSNMPSLFERRPAKVSHSRNEERKLSIEKRRLSRLSVDDKSNEPQFLSTDKTISRKLSRRSIDDQPYEEPANVASPIPLFDNNAEQLSEDEDPFAELDQQYHVAVDHNFIETYDSSPQPSVASNRSPTANKESVSKLLSDKNSNNIKKEIDSQLQGFAKSPLKLSLSNNEMQKISNTSDIQIKQELCITPVKNNGTNDNLALGNNNTYHEHIPEYKEVDKQSGNSENIGTMLKSLTPSSARKRSLDQKPAHRKEKRKKSECSQSDSNQQILNKNIIINVNDCASKKAEKCAETAKSIFNLYFSKGDKSKDQAKDSSKVDSVDKNYSDKYVKRKESKEKQNETKKKQHTSSSSHSIVSPKDGSSKSSSSSQTLKSDAKKKLKDINIFVEQPKKVSMHQAHRNTAVPPKTPDKIVEENKVKPNSSHKKNKPEIVHLKKLLSKETQTFLSKKSTTRFTQTDKKKLIMKSVQTEPVAFEKSGPKSSDAFERMKEIDLEIQALLQEKFKLYSSLESKNSCPNNLETLGMTVLNVSPFEEDKAVNTVSENIEISEDAIVEEFTNIPVEELEQIAFESVQIETAPPTKRSRRQKVVQRERMNSASSTNKKNAKKVKTPNISLLEQILIDDRPIEDIIALDDLEASPVVKGRRKAQKRYKVQKKNSVKSTSVKDIFMKECFVLLNRDDISNYYRNLNSKFTVEIELTSLEDEPIGHDSKHTEVSSLLQGQTVVSDNYIVLDSSAVLDNSPEQESTAVGESVVNDIHFDMLDVSEDIVIGDMYEEKCTGDKDVVERVEVPVSEEIILDNSQSSVEEIPNTETGQADNQCKMYDYSTDENLRRDSITVTGNADAVLAIECIENNFLAACLDGNVYYFNGDGQLIATLRGSNLAVTCLTIVKEKYGTTVYTGSLDSRIRYYDLETGLEKGPECNVLSPIQTMDRAWDTVFVGTRTGFVLQFECKNNMLIPVSTVKFSDQSILALRALKEGPRKVLLVAARSEDVTIKDAQTGLLLRTLIGPKMTVYTLLYEDGKVYSGTSSHQIHVFDYSSGSHIGAHEGGKGAVCLRATGGLLFAGCYDGCVYIYREGEPRPLAQLRGPSLMLLSLAVVGSKIIAGYKDRGLYIWKIPLSILQEMIL